MCVESTCVYVHVCGEAKPSIVESTYVCIPVCMWVLVGFSACVSLQNDVIFLHKGVYVHSYMYMYMHTHTYSSVNVTNWVHQQTVCALYAYYSIYM